MELKDLVDILLQERHEQQLRNVDKAKKKEEEKSSSKDLKGKGVGGGSDPPKPSSPFSSSFSSSSSLSTSSKKKHVKTPFLKLDVKFDLPIYNGELVAEKLDKWLKKIEVYCKAQNILDDSSRI